jgi:hypothetical protein
MQIEPGPLRNGNPRGDPSKAPRCGAKTRRGTACLCPAMRNDGPVGCMAGEAPDREQPRDLSGAGGRDGNMHLLAWDESPDEARELLDHYLNAEGQTIEVYELRPYRLPAIPNDR